MFNKKLKNKINYLERENQRLDSRVERLSSEIEDLKRDLLGYDNGRLYIADSSNLGIGVLSTSDKKVGRGLIPRIEEYLGIKWEESGKYVKNKK